MATAAFGELFVKFYPFLSGREQGDAVLLVLAVALLLVAASAIAGISRARLVLSGIWAIYCVYQFPETPNHSYLVLWSLLLSVIGTGRGEEAPVASKTGVLVLVASVLFFSGVHKLLMRSYCHGEFWALGYWSDPRFRKFIELVGPAHEVARLQSLGAPLHGGGPYTLEWAPLVWVSRGVVACEILVPLLVLLRKSRSVGIGLSVGMMICIELVAREISFGIVVLNLLAVVGGIHAARIGLFVTKVAYGVACALAVWQPGWSWL